MSKLELTILKFTYAEVPKHMVLSIGDMHQNGIQHHAPPDDPYIYPVKLVFLYVLILTISTCF